MNREVCEHGNPEPCGKCKPVPPPEAQTEAEKIAYCAGWWAAMEQKRDEVRMLQEQNTELDRKLAALEQREQCRYPDCVDNGPEGKCIRWLTDECSGPKKGQA
jgi:hypothetical protein